MSADPQNPFSRWWWYPAPIRERVWTLLAGEIQNIRIKELDDRIFGPEHNPEPFEAAIGVLETIAELGPDDIVQLVAIINAMKNK